MSMAGAVQEQGRNRAGEELSRVKQSRAERGQELGRNWGGAGIGACKEQGRSMAGAGQKRELERSRLRG